jgi:hypothetical protein
MPSARRDRTRTSPCRSCSLEAELASLPHLRPEELGLSDLETAQAIGKSRTFFAQARAHSRIDLHTQRMIALVRHWINTTNRHTGGLPRKQPRFRSSWWSLCNTWMPCAAGREPERSIPSAHRRRQADAAPRSAGVMVRRRSFSDHASFRRCFPIAVGPFLLGKDWKTAMAPNAFKPLA